jgi:hypothetical protein
MSSTRGSFSHDVHNPAVQSLSQIARLQTSKAALRRCSRDANECRRFSLFAHTIHHESLITHHHHHVHHHSHLVGCSPDALRVFPTEPSRKSTNSRCVSGVVQPDIYVTLARSLTYCLLLLLELMLQWLASNFGSPPEISASLVVAVHAWSGRFFLRVAAPKKEPSSSAQRNENDTGGDDGDRFQLLSQETAVFFLTRIINCLLEENSGNQAAAPPPPLPPPPAAAPPASDLSVANKRSSADNDDPTMCPTVPDAKKLKVEAQALSPVATTPEISSPTHKPPLENATASVVAPAVPEFDVVVAQQPNHPGNQKFQGTFPHERLSWRMFVRRASIFHSYCCCWYC